MSQNMVKYLITYLLLKIMYFTLTQQQSVSAYSTLVSYPCYTDEECVNEFSNNATCQDDNCVCNESPSCIKYVRNIIGESCEFNLNCDIVNSHCSNNTCVCNDDYIISGQRRNCLKVAHSLNDSCEINGQCEIPLSVCSSNNICVCKIFHYEKDGKCYKKAGLSKNCIDSNNCLYIPNTKCENNKCVCDDGYVEDEWNTKCLKILTNITENCEHSKQCRGYLGDYATCVNSSCVCNEMYHLDEDNMKCRKYMVLGDVCNRDEDCHQLTEDQSRLECVLSKCKCRSPFIEARNECVINSAKSLSTVITAVLIFSMLLIVIFF